MTANQNEAKIKFILPGVEASKTTSRSIGPVSRSATQVERQLLKGFEIKQHFDLSPTSRAAASGKEATLEAAADDILALEMEDGFIFYTSAARLAGDLARLDPAAVQDGAVRLDSLRSRGPVSRGLGDWIIRALSVVGFKKDDIEQKILDLAKEKAKDWLGDKAGELIEKGTSWAGTKALMWAIEKQLDPGPGLYRWVDDEGAPGDLKAVEDDDFKDWHPDKPILVFIHGTASSTLGSFGDLREAGSAREWGRLYDKYDHFIYAFEHRTFSESPIDNALALARRLPAGARLSVVTHSRGGLVGDLLCMGALGEGLVDRFDREREDLEAADAEDRKNLQALGGELARKKFIIERYVRVASPAQGTLLASCHLDAFLSALLHLIGLVPYLQVSPVYAVAKRIILQIVKNRTDPRLVPGIEAMLPDSPLAALVGQAQPQKDTAIGVIAGDIEGGGLLKRVGVFLTDFIFFEEEDNDLVVDTESMFGGLAREQGHYFFDQGADVNHFRYFANNRTREALQAWLTAKTPAEIRPFRPIIPAPQPTPRRAPATGPLPVLFFLPGIMGSHLRTGDKDRVWFDFLDIALGGMQKIRINRGDIHPDGLFDRFYGDLCNYLEETHVVHRFAYDWRRPLEDAAGQLAAAIDKALHGTDQPVRIMAHSMGGLVVRMMMVRHRQIWRRMAARETARFVMLGTPNQGSHLMVETLLGMSDTIRMLSVLDGRHGLSWFLDLVADYPGALQLLPSPDFIDTGQSPHDYYDPRVWAGFKAINDDFWFGGQLGATPPKGQLKQVAAAWTALGSDLPDIDKIAYVAGYGQRTPCGIEVDPQGPRLRMIGTLDGDGSVTHKSGILDRLAQNERVWFMHADHAGLTGQEEAFPALLELLVRGDTARLPRTRPVVRGVEPTFRYDAGPVLYPTEQRLTRRLLGGRQPLARPGRTRYALSVSCLAMDLRHTIDPILVGHYEGDPIAGAEAQIDRHLIGGGLNQRYQMGMYAGAPGTTTVVIPKPNEEQILSRVQHGAVVIGLGHYGGLTAGNLGEAVRSGVLRYLLHLVDIEGGRRPEDSAPRDVRLATLLLGYNSTTNISIADSVHTIVRGVMEANRQFAEVMALEWRVAHLEFIELFLDVAISTAGVIRQLAERLAREAESMGCHLEPAATLMTNTGARPRLEAVSATNYWPRLSITDADRREDICPPECLEKPGPPPEIVAPLPTHPERRSELARRLRFMYLSQRARAETVVQQRQPGLVETMVASSIMDSGYKPDLSNALYQLLLPHDFKETARQIDRLVLVVDGYTANLPWEMLAVDAEPLVKKTAIVRQFSTTRYRPQVRNTLAKSAYVIGNPSTAGYYRAFPDPNRPEGDGLDPLPGAKQESQTVRDRLEAQGYDVVMAPSESKGVDVINKLYQKPYRIIHISAHGVFQAGQGEDRRSGVVLSEGLFLTAAEIGQLEVVPDLVFLNCCFLGRVDKQPSTAYNRLAYSVARELIEIGVRAVVVAGWAVRDDAGEFFAETFYRALLHEQRTFGEAIHEARQMTYADPRFRNCNTWGAYQAYGDPGFRMDPSSRGAKTDGPEAPVAIEELVAAIDRASNEASHAHRDAPRLRRRVQALLKQAPPNWDGRPEVLYACGHFFGELGDFREAIGYLKQAVVVMDEAGAVPIRAIEQLANFEARLGEHEKDTQKIHQAIARLQRLVQAASANGTAKAATPAVFNSERCALLGSAYKRLAGVLREWAQEADNPEIPVGIRQALEQSVQWYQKAEGEPYQPDFKPYNVQNRLALQAVLGTAQPEDADLARLAGYTAHKQFESSRKFWDLIMAGDGELIARIIDKSLMKPPASKGEPDAVQNVIDCYTQLVEQVPQSMRQFDSVVKQIDLLKTFAKKRARAEASNRPALKRLAGNLSRIAGALKPPVSPGNSVSETGPSAGETRDRVSPKKSAKGRARKMPPKRKPPKGGKRPKK
jgi:CHAT domain-containing protein/pimeloyl-ACP methyl ester carboxylesterase